MITSISVWCDLIINIINIYNHNKDDISHFWLPSYV